MQIQFRECDFFNLWIWIQFSTVPSSMEQQYIDEILNSWFFLGKLGGFNAENLQVQDTGLEISYMHYDDSQADDTLVSLMHNMSPVEYEGLWARCWFDLGTSDALALDVLINALQQFSKDYVEIEQVIVGGENEDWPTPDHAQADFVGGEYN
ncbi:DUF3531 family protein [Leptolyngbya iicbica]|uniref:DUF3531 family protein n=2 Tax=Cyanophyceae TaxID=3028117 RepID=A0A4Q7EG83_9CYAN|nr:DUF3531 family protein [Leptolyngbya sp. LK]RZM82335.1 DUF3531 family protein [Leptolyngbya sp. LK]